MLQQQETIIWRNVDNETLFLDTASGFYFSLNKTGSEIWNWLNDGLSVEEAAQKLSARHGLEYDDALADVRELLENLKDEKIIA